MTNTLEPTAATTATDVGADRLATRRTLRAETTLTCGHPIPLTSGEAFPGMHFACMACGTFAAVTGTRPAADTDGEPATGS